MAKLTKQNTSDKVFVYDNLTAIKGIREARQHWFRDTMHVHSYDDLARLSVDEIVAGLKAEKQIPSRTMIASWIAQAKTLAEAADEQEQTSNVKAAINVPHWMPIASFVLEFQVFENPDGLQQYRTTAHHIETDKNQLWSGIEQTECMHWMLAETGIPCETTVPSSQPEVEAPVNVPNYAVQFSDKLQRILAKTAKITGTSLPTQVPTVVDKPMPKSTVNPPQLTGFSDKMQQILVKTQKLTTKTT